VAGSYRKNAAFVNQVALEVGLLEFPIGNSVPVRLVSLELALTQLSHSALAVAVGSLARPNARPQAAAESLWHFSAAPLQSRPLARSAATPPWVPFRDPKKGYGQCFDRCLGV
jgi:hypothetical protein